MSVILSHSWCVNNLKRVGLKSKYITIWPKCVAVGRIDNDLVLFRIFGSKPLPQSMMTQFTVAYMSRGLDELSAD